MIIRVYTINKEEPYRFEGITGIVERKSKLDSEYVDDWLALKDEKGDVARFKLSQVECLVFLEH